jgi:hypothetical protein
VLICDHDNDRVVEVTVEGVFIRAILVAGPWGVAFSSARDAIAISSTATHSLYILDFATEAMKLTVISPKARFPRGITFSACGDEIVVAYYGRGCLTRYDAFTGDAIGELLTCESLHGSKAVSKLDVVQYGSGYSFISFNQQEVQEVMFTGKEGTVQNMPSWHGCDTDTSPFVPQSISAFCGGIIVKDRIQGRVLLYADRWPTSSRCAWLAACVF